MSCSHLSLGRLVEGYRGHGSLPQGPKSGVESSVQIRNTLLRGFQRIGVVGMSAPDGAVTIFAIGGAVVALCCNQAARNDIDGASPGRVRRLAHVCSARKSHRCTVRMLLHGRGGPSDRERLGPLPPMPAPLFAPRETALSRMRTRVLHLEPRELRACEMLLRRVRTLCTEWCDFQ